MLRRGEERDGRCSPPLPPHRAAKWPERRRAGRRWRSGAGGREGGRLTAPAHCAGAAGGRGEEAGEAGTAQARLPVSEAPLPAAGPRRRPVLPPPGFPPRQGPGLSARSSRVSPHGRARGSQPAPGRREQPEGSPDGDPRPARPQVSLPHVSAPSPRARCGAFSFFLSKCCCFGHFDATALEKKETPTLKTDYKDFFKLSYPNIYIHTYTTTTTPPPQNNPNPGILRPPSVTNTVNEQAEKQPNYLLLHKCGLL